MDYSRFKPKKQKWLEYAVFFAVVIMIVGYAVFSNINNTEEPATTEEPSKPNYLIYIIPAGIIAYLILNSKTALPPPKTVEEIIKTVADTVYNDRGIYLNTTNSNVRVQRGAPDETYVEFLTESFTYLYLENVGIIEKYPGESIKAIKKAKAEDKIQMKLAEIGIARKKHMEKLEELGLTTEEQE